MREHPDLDTAMKARRPGEYVFALRLVDRWVYLTSPTIKTELKVFSTP